MTRQNAASQTPYPPENLVPEAMLGENAREFSAELAARLPAELAATYDLPAELAGLLRWVVLHDNLAGLARPLGKQASLCALPRRWLAKDDPRHALLAAIEKALSDPYLKGRYPELWQPPRTPILALHQQVAQNPGYPELVLLLQAGLLKVLADFPWPTQQPEQLINHLTGVRRTFASLAHVDLAGFRAALAEDDLDAINEVVWAGLQSLERVRGNPDDPLKNETLVGYLRSFFLVVFQQDDIQPRLARPPEVTFRGNWRKPVRPLDPLDDDDDLPEGPRAPDGWRESNLLRLEQLAAQPVGPDDAIEQEAEAQERAASAVQRLHAPANVAVLREHPDPLDWNVLSPFQVGFLLERLFAGMEADPKTVPTATFLLSVLLTGRNPVWLEQVKVGSRPAEEDVLDGPRYLPDEQALIFPVEQADLPERPYRTADLYQPVARYTEFALPPVLQAAWRQQATKVGHRSLFAGLAKAGRQVLKDAQAAYVEQVQGDATFTFGRLARAGVVMLETVGGLDPLLAALISGQWRPSHRAPTFYTTIDTAWLAERYWPACEKAWVAWGGGTGSIRPVPEPQAQPTATRIGSPYRMTDATLEQVLDGLEKHWRKLKAEPTPERHNLETGLALFGFSLEGLRIAEAGFILPWQLDLDYRLAGEPFPLLNLPDTKGSRFFSAARMLPLPLAFVLRLARVRAGDESESAFYFYSRSGNGKTVPCIGDNLSQYFRELGLPFPRWHAGRHWLRSRLMERDFPFDWIGAVLGHQSAGRELHHLLLPHDPFVIWRAFRDEMDTLLADLDWSERFGEPG